MEEYKNNGMLHVLLKMSRYVVNLDFYTIFIRSSICDMLKFIQVKMVLQTK